jgi:TonB dependent receptor
VGNFSPVGASELTLDASGSAKRPAGSGALRYRYFGPRPLTEDGAFISPSTGLLNGQVGYRFENGWRIQLDAFNIPDSKSDQITYAYGSLLKSDSLFAMCFPGGAARASRCLLERRDGPRAAPGRATGASRHARRSILPIGGRW